MEFAYMGFTQSANMRSFLFERIARPVRAGDPRRVARFTVTADISMFPQFHVPIQEGPQLSLQILAEALANENENSAVPESLPIEFAHLLAFATNRDREAEEKKTRRKPKFTPRNPV